MNIIWRLGANLLGGEDCCSTWLGWYLASEQREGRNYQLSFFGLYVQLLIDGVLAGFILNILVLGSLGQDKHKHKVLKINPESASLSVTLIIIHLPTP